MEEQHYHLLEPHYPSASLSLPSTVNADRIGHLHCRRADPAPPKLEDKPRRIQVRSGEIQNDRGPFPRYQE
jgi:hypothetical protein